MTVLFPIGTLSNGSGTGSLNSVSYSPFEPNGGCKSTPVYNNYTTKFQQQTLLTRKQGLPFLQISYEYNNIFSSEYNQIEHFISSVEDNLTSFFVVDYSKGIDPATITNSYDFLTNNTRLYSEVANQKANNLLFSNGYKWKFATITNISANTSVTVNVTATNNAASFLGDLTSTQVTAAGVFVYPVYECYTTGNSLDNFKKGEYIIDSVERGFMYSGELNFVSKYKI